ncbi:MAG TPA: membrane protein insertase YidC [Candidatus Binatia bacterium]|nr:membrane protein insertase YidC [Candidatus Binatia bacterium]
MEKRALIAVAISLAILVIYQEVILKRLYPPPPVQPEGAAESIPSPVERSAPPNLPAIEPAAEVPRVAAAAGGRDVTIDTPLYRAVITTGGGRLKSFQLKRYRTSVAPDSPPQEMVYIAGGEYPLGVQLRGKESASDVDVVYQSDQEALQARDGEAATLTLTGTLGSTHITKKLTFRGDAYLIGLDVAANTDVPYGELGITWDKSIEAMPVAGTLRLYEQVSLLQAKKVVHEPFDKLAEGMILEKDIQWAGYDGRYFMAALVPANGEAMRLWLKKREHNVETMLLVPPQDGRLTAQFDLYIGPKDVDTLEATGHSLSRAVDLGYFAVIAVPLMHALKLSHQITGNYGLDIILLTVVIKVLFIPLTRRSFKSMKEMQKLQPQMAKIREKFKDQPDQMNKEIMELYRRHKVNPLGGCLPMVLQIPVFIGLYNALSHAIELRHAPFFLWINDLSAPDRLGTLAIPFVSPPGIPVMTLLMGASMFVQQWMTPSTGDPQQQRVMMIMPLMFTFMFVSFPAGLTLYWLVNNVLTIGQQYAINRPER